MPPNMLIRRHPCAERRIAVRALATDTAACCSSALAASLADSLSTSIELPSACVTPTEASACVVNAVRSTAVLASEEPSAAASAPWKSTSTRR